MELKNPRPTPAPSSRTTVVRFLVWFLLLLVVLSVAVSILFGQFPAASASLLAATARLVGVTASLVCDDVSVAGDLVTHRNFSIRVVGECTGLVEIVIFLAAVLAFPTSVARRAVGAVAGSVVIVAANIVRMVTLLIIGSSSQYWFDVAHYYAYQVSMILLIVATWLTWFYFAVLGKWKKPGAVPA